VNSIWLAAAIVCGAAAGLQIIGLFPAGLAPDSGTLLLLLGMIAIVLALATRGYDRPFWSCLVVGCFIAALGRTLLIHAPVTPADVAFYNSLPEAPPVAVTGVVAAEPILSDRSQRLRISARTIRPQSGSATLAVRGDLTVILPRYPEYGLGETLMLTGVLTVPPTFEDFDYAAYLARQGLFSQMSFPKVVSLGRKEETGLISYLIEQRTAARKTLQSVVAEPEASIAVGVVTGDRTSMSDRLQDAFRRSGTTHILAISGENISLLVGMLWLFFGGRRNRRRMPTLLALTVIVLLASYTIFTGATPSVVRAAIMGTVLLLGPVVGRRYDPLAALAVSAASMVVVDPDLLADAGFQFSFLALVGITFLSPLIVSALEHVRMGRLALPGALIYPLGGSLGAVAATFPIFTLLTGQLSLVAPIATLTADFALPVLMVAGIATVIIGALGPTFALVAGLLVWPSAWWLQANAQFWAAMPWSSVNTADFGPAHALVYYTVLTFLVVLNEQRQHIPTAVRRLRAFPATALLTLTAVAIWAVALYMFLS
jgi:competence protein ComEC